MVLMPIVVEPFYWKLIIISSLVFYNNTSLFLYMASSNFCPSLDGHSAGCYGNCAKFVK